MPSTLKDICFDCTDQLKVARFWADVFDYEMSPLDRPADPTEPICITPNGNGGTRMWFNQVPEPRNGKNRVHIDINMSSKEEMRRLRRLGAMMVQEVRGEDGDLWWTVMCDPEGNEFCAFPPRQG